MDTTSKRLEEAKALFDSAFDKAIKAVIEAKTELTRPLTPIESEEMETWKEGKMEL